MRRKDLREVIVFKDYTMKEEDFRGFFHCWSVDFEEFETGPGQHPIAIVEEKTSGEVKLVYPTRIRFETV
jgi:hypothetical protein